MTLTALILATTTCLWTDQENGIEIKFDTAAGKVVNSNYSIPENIEYGLLRNCRFDKGCVAEQHASFQKSLLEFIEGKTIDKVFSKRDFSCEPPKQKLGKHK